MTLSVSAVFEKVKYKVIKPIFLSKYIMLDHPITVVLNVFDTSNNNGLKVYKFMSIQTQEVFALTRTNVGVGEM